MSEVTPTTRITQLPIDECKDWILHAYEGIDDEGELWFGRPIEQKKLWQCINDLISWSVYSRYRYLN